MVCKTNVLFALDLQLNEICPMVRLHHAVDTKIASTIGRRTQRMLRHQVQYMFKNLGSALKKGTEFKSVRSEKQRNSLVFAIG